MSEQKWFLWFCDEVMAMFIPAEKPKTIEYTQVMGQLNDSFQASKTTSEYCSKNKQLLTDITNQNLEKKPKRPNCIPHILADYFK